MRPFAAAALAALSLLAACGKDKKGEQASQPPRPAMTLVATPTPALETAFSGTVQPQTQSALSFRVLGRIISRPVKTGDRVAAGQMVAAVDPTAYEAAARAASATLASARAQFDNAVSTEGRQSALLAKKTASQAAFDSAEQARASTQAAMEQAAASLVKAKEQLSYTVLKAEYAGIVTGTSAEIGQTVAPGQAVVTVADPKSRDAVIDAPEAVIDAFLPGEKFTVSLQIDPSVTATGALREISPESDAATRSRRLKIALDQPPPEFRLGSTISARVAAEEARVIRLPASALLQEGDLSSVFVVDPATMTVALRRIDVAPDRDGRFLVRGGLNAGERVVIAGVHRLAPGQHIRLFGSAQ